MIAAVTGTFLMASVPGLPMFISFLVVCCCFGYIALRHRLWWLFLAQVFCFLSNVYGIIRILTGTWS